MDLWEIGSLIAGFVLSIFVFTQGYHIHKSKDAGGFKLSIWIGFVFILSYFTLFTIIKNQNLALTINYFTSTIANMFVAYMIYKHQKKK